MKYPNSPASSAFHCEEIPKFYKGQPGYKGYQKEIKKSVNHKTMPGVEWKTDLWGKVQAL